jgi:hypothetical protein
MTAHEKKRMARLWLVACTLLWWCVTAQPAAAQSFEEQNDCQGTSYDPCVRVGACSIQGATWEQTVTIARTDLYDTMGWPGLCDQVHVALVQGSCSPGGAQLNVTAFLDSDSDASIPEIVGPLACGAEPPPEIPVMPRIASIALAGGLLGCGLLFLARRPGSRLAIRWTG